MLVRFCARSIKLFKGFFKSFKTIQALSLLKEFLKTEKIILWLTEIPYIYTSDVIKISLGLVNVRSIIDVNNPLKQVQ